MQWTAEEISEERPLLQTLASFKYNEYQQYTAGIRFFESLVRWLNQFTNVNERRIAYTFFKENLIFISNEQISYLVNITYNEIINPIIINKTAKEIFSSKHLVRKITESQNYKTNLRKCLFIGLSDGSRIDQFRRSSGVSNEQVTTTHEISESKSTNMLEELHAKTDASQKFHTVFLIDDFTASGKSYFRPEEKKGKVYNFLDKIYLQNDTSWNELVDKKDHEVHIVFYIATQDAINSLTRDIHNWKIQNSIQNEIVIHTAQIIDKSVKDNVIKNSEFLILIKKYFDNSIVDRHYIKGIHNSPFLGFNECALPLVLNHNTPNNSLPILWFPEDKKIIGLFPRISRHKE
ncbi:MAG: hypothetical protein ABR927_16245 [Bacteroidales bacterium]|jgi:hypothetical protein